MSDATNTMDRILEDLTDRFRAGSATRQRDDLAFVTVPQNDAVAAVTHLKEFWEFRHLVYFTAVDIIERGLFRLCYMLHSYTHNLDVCLQTEIMRDGATMQSIHHLWAAAAVYQRELREMFGIDFPGCPRVKESFALEGWTELPPMRRDFDTRAYSEATYYPREGREKHDKAAILKKALYPEVDL
jgi:NADH-quinone oxidoreductase subunit C